MTQLPSQPQTPSPTGPSPAPSPTRRLRRRGAILAAIVAATLISAVVFYGQYYQSAAGKAQPIPFSHRFHAGEKQISCLVCHPGLLSTARSGVPPLQTCMMCHERIIINYPPIKDLRNHYYNNEPIAWNRVNELPEFVYFNHQAHIRRGVDCGHCHGNVQGMDRITLAHDFEMGFCVQCHRDNGVSHDCYTCHR